MPPREFNQLLVDNIEHLKPFAFFFTRDGEKAKDLVQETLCRALASQEKYSNNTNIKGWLFTVMRNTFINNYRRARIEKKIFSASPVEFPKNRGHITPDTADARLDVKEILAAIQALPDILRVAFCLHFEGYKYEEIAQINDIALGTIKSRIHLARKLIIKKISKNTGYNN